MEVIRVDEGNFDVFNSKALILTDLHREEEAVVFFDRALELFENMRIVEVKKIT